MILYNIGEQTGERKNKFLHRKSQDNIENTSSLVDKARFGICT